MRSTILSAIAVAASLVQIASAQSPTVGTAVEAPSGAPRIGTPVVQGCYSGPGTLKASVTNATIQWNSIGSCANDVCAAQGFKVAASSGGNLCFCGNQLPPKSLLVDDSQCNIGCTGYGQDACGGLTTFTVYNTGLVLSVDSSGSSSVSSSTSPSATTSGSTPASTTIVAGGQTSVVYVTASATAAPESASSSGPSIGGIVAGVVIGVLAVAGIIAGIFFYRRHLRNREIEEEHRRSAAVNAFMSGKPPGSSGGYSIDTDARMDPVMAQRRMSSGSIADNEDYSRRILRVTNA